MPRQKFHALKRPKIRQTWSKYNLYNLSRLFTPPAANKTFFQQKWLAKSLTRAFHHPQVKEKHWERMFDRRLPAVVPMDYRYLAKHDGAEMALGRGSGVAQKARSDGESGRERRKEKTPYMHMTFHPLERRLDTAIWRALFASSTKQARQFVVHGGVKVNGKTMLHPSYRLNPGDMFQVDPEKVMYATGARKRRKNSPVSKQQIAQWREWANEAREREQEKKERAEESNAGAAAVESDEAELHADDPKKALKSLLSRAQAILDDSRRHLSGKRQQDLRHFSRQVRTTMSKLRGIDESAVEETIDGLESGLAEILTKIPQDTAPTTKPEGEEMGSAAAAQAQDAATNATESSEPSSRANAELLAAALERARENPRDASKPYATPWQPREFMSAFAFIPRYLEVNQNICSAVYLRHPVARPGLAEVPTPYAGETMELAFNWYLRRR